MLHYVHVRARCMQPIHAWRAYTDKLRGDSRHASTSCGVLPGSTADGHSCECCRLFASQSNSQLGPLREFRTLAEVKFRFLAFGSSMVWVGPSMSHDTSVVVSHVIFYFFFFFFFYRLPPRAGHLLCGAKNAERLVRSNTSHHTSCLPGTSRAGYRKPY